MLVLGTRKCQLRSIDVESWRMVEGGLFGNIQEQIIEDLIKSEIVVPADEDELATVLGRKAAASGITPGSTWSSSPPPGASSVARIAGRSTHGRGSARSTRTWSLSE